MWSLQYCIWTAKMEIWNREQTQKMMLWCRRSVGNMVGSPLQGSLSLAPGSVRACACHVSSRYSIYLPSSKDLWFSWAGDWCLWIPGLCLCDVTGILFNVPPALCPVLSGMGSRLFVVLHWVSVSGKRESVNEWNDIMCVENQASRLKAAQRVVSWIFFPILL